jgi:mannose-6-phosphate isomerase class I
MLGFYTMAEADNIVQVTDGTKKDIQIGVDSVASAIALMIKSSKKERIVIGLDGYIGVAWEDRMDTIALLLRNKGLMVVLFDIRDCYINNVERAKIVDKSLSVDPYWGRVTDNNLEDFIDKSKFAVMIERIKKAEHVALVYGPGALCKELFQLCDYRGYIDTTQEILFNKIDQKAAEILSSDSIYNLTERQIHRQLIYIDFEVLKKQRIEVLKKVNWYFIDHPDKSFIMVGIGAFEAILDTLSKQPFRMKPFYFPRVWGGDFLIPIRRLPMKKCSFYIEVGPGKSSIRILAGEAVLDIPFLTFMIMKGSAIVGDRILKYFHGHFPLTSNYDDTIGGGSLALQCHPGKKQMQERYNEDNTHDESYYVVKTMPGAKTYHGLQDNIDWDEFHRLAERADKEHIPFDYNEYVNSWPSQEGDMYLLPSGTTHASGENQIVLEIDADGSKNGQEYTYHVYDFLRPDLDGSYRTIHNDHYFGEVRREAEKKWTSENLKQPLKLVTSGPWGEEFCIGDYHEMSYISNRIELKQDGIYKADMGDSFYMLVLTKGDRILVRKAGDPTDKGYIITYTEALIIPHSMGKYEIVNLGSPCHVIKTFVRTNLE